MLFKGYELLSLAIDNDGYATEIIHEDIYCCHEVYSCCTDELPIDIYVKVEIKS